MANLHSNLWFADGLATTPGHRSSTVLKPVLEVPPRGPASSVKRDSNCPPHIVLCTSSILYIEFHSVTVETARGRSSFAGGVIGELRFDLFPGDFRLGGHLSGGGRAYFDRKSDIRSIELKHGDDVLKKKRQRGLDKERRTQVVGAFRWRRSLFDFDSPHRSGLFVSNRWF